MNNILKSIILILLYVPFLILVYYLYINVFNVNVVFYSSVAASILALLLYGTGLQFSSILNSFRLLEKLQLLCICFLLGYIFSISLPAVIDRSLSFYILEKLQQRGGGIKLSKLDYVFINEYMKEHHLLDIRVTEQLQSKTITLDGDCIKLTPFGNNMAKFSRFFRANFLPKKRLLRDTYTDALVDPFAQSEKDPDYKCQ